MDGSIEYARGSFIRGVQAGSGWMLVDSVTKYAGEIEDGDAQGLGTLSDTSDGFVYYTGMWKRNQMHGRGTHHARSGVSYTGEYSDNARHGLGKEERSDGSWEGEWQFGLQHGYGLLLKKEGNQVARVGRWQFGEFKDETPIPRRVLPTADYLDPEGEKIKINPNTNAQLMPSFYLCLFAHLLIFHSISACLLFLVSASLSEFIGLSGFGVRYSGDRDPTSHLPHGSGSMTDIKLRQKVAEGTYVEGLLQGEGFAMFSDGSTYVGFFHEGMMHGTGTLTWPAGDVYNGEFQNDNRQGNGTIIFPDGNTYTGGWEKDAMHGLGVIEWIDGSVFEGEMSRGLKDGLGVIWLASGERVRTGKFVGGSFSEPAPVPRSIIKEGKRLKPHEKEAQLLLPEGKVYVGEMNQNKQAHGTGSVLDDKQQVVETGVWENGVKIKPATEVKKK